MWTRLGLTLLMALGGWAFYSPPDAQAECRIVASAPTYTAGQLKDLTCDENGLLQTNAAATTATATDAAPTHTEGAAASLWVDLAGLLHIAIDEINVLISGEDQTNNLLMTSGGAVRTTVMATAVTTNTTSTASILPVGTKRIYGSVDGTGAIVQTQTIYGGLTSGVTATNGELLCVLTLSGTTHDHAGCTVTTAHLFYIVVTTATSGTGATGVITAMY